MFFVPCRIFDILLRNNRHTLDSPNGFVNEIGNRELDNIALFCVNQVQYMLSWISYWDFVNPPLWRGSDSEPGFNLLNLQNDIWMRRFYRYSSSILEYTGRTTWNNLISVSQAIDCTTITCTENGNHSAQTHLPWTFIGKTWALMQKFNFLCMVP